MTEPAAQRFNRLVGLVAECSRREAGSEPSYGEIADMFGVTPETILRDVRTLGDVSDHSQNDGLLSLLAQEGDRVLVECQGAFRRPIRLTGEEVLAIKVALALEDDPPLTFLRALSGAGALDTDATEDQLHALPARALHEHDVVDTILGAIDSDEAVHIEYAAPEHGGEQTRRVDPHRIISREGQLYMLGWCHSRDDWRRFRVDRILEVSRTSESRSSPDALPAELHGGTFGEPEGGVDEATVRFSPAIARWLVERYPSGTEHEDGSLDVTFHVASADWLVRHVLQYGAEAEVIAPMVYRGAVRKEVRGER